MDEDKARLVKIIFSIACVVIAVTLFFVLNKPLGGGAGGDRNTKYLLCTNEECGASQKLTKDEYYDLLVQAGSPRMVMNMAFICSTCGEETAYKADKCIKCQTIFLQDLETDDYSDRCPDCGHSKEEERIRNLK